MVMTTQTDEQAAREYAEFVDEHEVEGVDEDMVEAFLAGIAYRDSQKQEVVQGFEEALARINVYEGYDLAQKEMWLAACESMEAKHREEIEQLEKKVSRWEDVCLTKDKEIDFMKKQVDLIASAANRVSDKVCITQAENEQLKTEIERLRSFREETHEEYRKQRRGE
jgi:septal ring factor EnvC (AmiA/AmiB activator)